MTDATPPDDPNALFIEDIENSDSPGYDSVVGQVSASLAAIRDRLKLLREQKEQIRVEIKQLVSQQLILERMERIATKDQTGEG